MINQPVLPYQNFALYKYPNDCCIRGFAVAETVAKIGLGGAMLAAKPGHPLVISWSVLDISGLQGYQSVYVNSVICYRHY